MPSQSPEIRVLVADDHPFLREGVIAILQNYPEFQVVGEAENGLQAVSKYRELTPDVVLMDLQMPEMGGLEAMEEIRSEFPEAKVVVLTTYAGDVQAVRALKGGASGYLLKNSLRMELVDAIRSVHSGARHLDREVADEIALHVVDETLTERETAILKLIAIGKANKQVAWELQVAEETIKSNLKSIFGKLNVGDRTHAVTVALRRGIIQL